MHELGVLSAIVKTIGQIVADEQLTKVDTIVLQVGELSGIVPSYLEECYPAAVYKTPFAETKLELEIIPGIARCRECGREFNVLASNLKCPVCFSENLEALSGREFTIKEIHAC